MNSDLVSRPYQPDQTKCCEACVFGRGEHAEWCNAPRLCVHEGCKTPVFGDTLHCRHHLLTLEYYQIRNEIERHFDGRQKAR